MFFSGATDIQGHHCPLGVQVSAHCQEHLTQTLFVRLLRTHFFTMILDCQKSTEDNWVGGQTWSEVRSFVSQEVVQWHDTACRVGAALCVNVAAAVTFTQLSLGPVQTQLMAGPFLVWLEEISQNFEFFEVNSRGLIHECVGACPVVLRNASGEDRLGATGVRDLERAQCQMGAVGTVDQLERLTLPEKWQDNKGGTKINWTALFKPQILCQY